MGTGRERADRLRVPAILEASTVTKQDRRPDICRQHGCVRATQTHDVGRLQVWNRQIVRNRLHVISSLQSDVQFLSGNRVKSYHRHIFLREETGVPSTV